VFICLKNRLLKMSCFKAGNTFPNQSKPAQDSEQNQAFSNRKSIPHLFPPSFTTTSEFSPFNPHFGGGFHAMVVHPRACLAPQIAEPPSQHAPARPAVPQLGKPGLRSIHPLIPRLCPHNRSR